MSMSSVCKYVLTGDSNVLSQPVYSVANGIEFTLGGKRMAYGGKPKGAHFAPSCSVVSLERAGPGVGGGIVFPLSVSIGFALELLLTDVLIGVVGVDSGSRNGSDHSGNDEFHK